jgi:hypothetical protein
MGAASASDAFVIAAMNVGRQANYTWVTTVEIATRAPRTVTFQGTTQVGGYSRIATESSSGPAIYRLGGNLIGQRIDLLFLGSDRGVFDTAEGWRRLEQLPDPMQRQQALNSLRGTNGPSGAPPGTRLFDQSGPLSTPILHVRLPHDDLQVLVATTTNIQRTAEGFTATLNGAGASHFEETFGVAKRDILQISGTVEARTAGNLVNRYVVTLDVVADVGRGQRLSYRQTTTTQLREVGTTRVEIPPAALELFGR